MENAINADDLSLLLKLLRALRGWGQTDLAEVAGIDPSSIQRYEGGRTMPPLKTVERLVAAVGLPMSFVEACLIPALRAARALLADSEPDAEEDLVDLTGDSEWLDRTLLAAAQSAIAASVGAEQPRFQEPWPRQIAPVPEDRLTAEDAWNRLRSCTKRERLFLVERAPEFRTWAVAERLCHESMAASPDSADRAIELAELGVHVATLSGGEAAWRSNLEGYALAFFANAMRVRAHLEKAESTLGQAWSCWQLGKRTELLPAWRLFTIEGSLRRELFQYREALECIDRALKAAPPDQVGSLLLTKVTILEQNDEAKQAVEVLREAEGVLQFEKAPRLRYVWWFNLVLLSCKLGRSEEAAALMPEVRKLGGALQNRLDSIRLLWLEAQVAVAKRNFTEARVLLERVHSELASYGLDSHCSSIAQELNALSGQVESDSREPGPGTGSNRNADPR